MTQIHRTVLTGSVLATLMILSACGGGGPDGPDTTTPKGACAALHESGSLDDLTRAFDRYQESFPSTEAFDEVAITDSLEDIKRATSKAPARIKEPAALLVQDMEDWVDYVNGEGDTFVGSAALRRELDDLNYFCS